MGTAAYMAPEQARGEAVDHRADIWSFGLVLYEMVKGTRPAQAVRLRVEASPELERIVSKCLETERELRYQHAADLRTDLERLKRGRTRRNGRRTASSRGARRAGVVVAAAAVAVALAVVGATSLSAVRRDADRQGHDRARRVHQHDRRSGVRRHAATRTRGTAPAIAVPQPGVGRPHPKNAGVDEPAGGCAADSRHCAGRVRADRRAPRCWKDRSPALGSQYVLGLRATNCATGDILADEQAQAARKEEVLSTLSQIATRFRTRVGESLATIEKHSTPLEEATTPSLEALKAYSAATKRDRVIRLGAAPAATSSVRSRSIPTLRWPMRSRVRLQLVGRVGAGAAEPAQGLPVARSGQRRRALLHRDTVRPRLHWQSGTGAADTGNVGRDLSARSAASRIARRSSP